MLRAEVEAGAAARRVFAGMKAVGAKAEAEAAMRAAMPRDSFMVSLG